MVAAHPDLRRCDRVNNVRRLADLQAKAGERAAALASHRGVISACEDFSVVAASLEKAAASATAADLDAPFALAGPRFADRTAEVSALRTRLLAGLGAPAVKTTPSVRAAASAAAVREDWAACLAATVDPRAIELLYQRAWCAYGHDRHFEALAGFRAAAAGGMDAAATRDAGFGMALVFLAEGMTDAAAEIAATVDLTLAQRRQVEIGILDQRAVQAMKSRRIAARSPFSMRLSGCRAV